MEVIKCAESKSNMGEQTQSGSPLLTIEEVLRAHEKLRECDRQIAALEEQKVKVSTWLEAVEKLIGRERMDAILGEDREPPVFLRTSELRGERTTWTAFLDNLVRERGGKVSYSDAKEAVRASPELGPIFERTEKSFHGALGKLESARRVVRHQGWVFTPEAYAQHRAAVERGEAVEMSGFNSSARRSPMGEAVLSFVYGHPQGVVSKEVVEHVKGIDEFRAVVERNATNVYNILTRLVLRGQLRKEGTTYFPPNRGNENSGSK